LPAIGTSRRLWQEVKELIEMRGDFLQLKPGRARRRKLDGQRKPIETAANLGHQTPGPLRESWGS
jgi:hypothetical protein